MSRYCFGIDIGGTSTKMGLFDMEGTIIEKWEIPTRIADAGKNILPDIAAAVQSKIKEKAIEMSDIAGAGVGVPGPVDADGVVHTTANLGWGVVDIKGILSDLLGMPVKAGNDANVAALGEMWKGGGKGYKNLVAVTLGTGVGGGIITNGQMLTGAIGAGGEIGHIPVEDTESESCGCGNTGCLEQYASATGIVRLARRKLEKNQKTTVLTKTHLSAKTVFDAVKAGDEVAMEVAEEFGNYLGKGLACVAGIVNPEIFVIGGGVSHAGPIVIDYIKKYYIPNVYSASREAVFALATLGNDAGIYGAAKMVIE